MERISRASYLRADQGSSAVPQQACSADLFGQGDDDAAGAAEVTEQEDVLGTVPPRRGVRRRGRDSVDLKVMPLDSVTLSDGYDPRERAPTRLWTVSPRAPALLGLRLSSGSGSPRAPVTRVLREMTWPCGK